MKKLVISVLLAASIIVVTGCDEDGSADNGVTGWQIKTYSDPSTGCQYIIFDGNRGGGITPEMGRDHQQICK